MGRGECQKASSVGEIPSKAPETRDPLKAIKMIPDSNKVLKFKNAVGRLIIQTSMHNYLKLHLEFKHHVQDVLQILGSNSMDD